MIDTKYIREQIARAQELPWMLATSNSWRRFVDARHTPVCQPIAQSDGHPDLLFVGGAEGPNAQLLIGAVNTLPKLLDNIDAQAAEIAQLKAAQAWQPIETAPSNETVLIGRWDCDGGWYAWVGSSSSGWKIPLRRDKPTHWMPLPDAPEAPQETTHDR